MKVQYDKEVDALYIKFSNKTPEGAIEISEGVNIDSSTDGQIIGIEILNASQKLDINTVLSYTIELDKKILNRKTA